MASMAARNSDDGLEPFSPQCSETCVATTWARVRIVIRVLTPIHKDGKGNVEFWSGGEIHRTDHLLRAWCLLCACNMMRELHQKKVSHNRKYRIILRCVRWA